MIMKLIVFAIILHQVASLNLPESKNRIINGEEATPGQLPYQALLYATSENGGVSCGAALIHESWVLTAAHCLIGSNRFEVHLGSIHYFANQEGRVIITSDTAIMHEGYIGNEPKNDIGLVKLPTPVSFTNLIQPVKLPPANAGNFDNEVAITSGWGFISNEATLDLLNFVRLTVLSAEVCTGYFGNFYNEDLVICAWDYDANRSGICYGDSGGPFVHRDLNILIGIVSFYHWNGCGMGPSGFTRVSAYLSWIAEKAGI